MKLRLSVTQLVDFSCRTGDLVLDKPQGPTAKEGIRAHQHLQNLRDKDTDAEVTLTLKTTLDGVDVTLKGRVDLLKAWKPDTAGVLSESAEANLRQSGVSETINTVPEITPEIVPEITPEITEIKSTLVNPDRIPTSVLDLHRAQLKVYGYCYLQQLVNENEGVVPTAITLNICWFNLTDQSTHVVSDTVDFRTLKQFTRDALKRYIVWFKQVEAQRKETRTSAKSLTFPFAEFRQGQRDMAAATYRVCRDGGHLLCEAPTGIGKTVSTLFPGIKALGDKHVKQLVYLTAKTSGRTAALDSVGLMREQGLSITAVVIQSKATICQCQTGEIERERDGSCPYSKGFFDRLPGARESLLQRQYVDRDTLNEVAATHEVCPFELVLQLLPWFSVVICDYNYVFDPLVRLTCFQSPPKTTVLLIDEAHNLVDRARSMHSAQLSRVQARSVAHELKPITPATARAIAKLPRSLKRHVTKHEADKLPGAHSDSFLDNKPGHQSGHRSGHQLAHQLARQVEFAHDNAPDNITKIAREIAEAAGQEESNAALIPAVDGSFFRELYRYLAIEDLYGDSHRTITTHERLGSKDIQLQLSCLNAESFLRASFKTFRSVVLFSATLSPAPFYREALGLPDNTQGMTLPSPFDPNRLGVFHAKYIDTRYRARQHSQTALVDAIASVTSAKPGNYLVFFGSYAYMDAVYQEYSKRYPAVKTAVQPRQSSQSDRDDFLSHFNSCEPVTGFAILGGVFGEGVDFPGDKLVGTLIAGTGLPAMSLEQQLISECYEQQGRNGFDHAGRYPGFTRVLQTAGRVIRTANDRGVVVLLDTRFSEPFYRALYPDHWQVISCANHQELTNGIVGFWDDQSSWSS